MALGVVSILALFANIVQFIAAVVALGLAGANYHYDDNRHHSLMIYTIVIALLTIITLFPLLFLALRPSSNRFILIAIFAWSWILVILWAVDAGILGKRYLHTGPMQLAALFGFALVELICWFFTAIAGAIGFFGAGRKSRGGATV